MLSLDVFKDGMGALLEAFPDRKFNNKIIYKFMQDLSKEEFLSGIAKVISSTKELFPGTNIIALIRENAKVENKLSAGEAWAEVRAEIGRVGCHGCPKFSDPLITMAASAVGWRDMCMSENIMIERAHFLKIYESLCNRKKEEATYLPAPMIKNLIGQVKTKEIQ